jgi:hypothetical protein
MLLAMAKREEQNSEVYAQRGDVEGDDCFVSTPRRWFWLVNGGNRGLSAADSGSATRRVLASTTSLLADVLLDMLVGLGSAYTSSEVATDLVLEFQGCDCSWAGQRLQTGAGRPWYKALVLTAGVGKKLLLVEVHLPLDLELSVG